MEHSMHIFARLVRMLLGETSIAERKLECGLELVVLGVLVALVRTRAGFSFLRPFSRAGVAAQAGCQFCCVPCESREVAFRVTESSCHQESRLW